MFLDINFFKVSRKDTATMQTLKNQKFYKRLITTFIIVSVLPCILIGLFSSILVERVIQDRLIREASLTTENAISSISGLIAKYANALEIFSMNDSVLSLLYSSNKDESQIKTIYAEMYNLQTSLHPSGDVHIIRTSDNYTISLHGTPNLYDYPKNQNWGNFRLANESDSVIIYPTLYTNLQNTEMAISVMRAIRKQEQIIGYIALDIPLDAVREQLKGTYDLLPIHFTLMTNHYYALFNDIGLDSKNSFITWSNRSNTERFDHQIEHINRNRILYTYQTSKPNKLVLVGCLNIELILGNLSLVTYILVATIIISLLVCILISFIVSKRINTPVKRMIDTMRLMESGDFNQNIEVRSNDEFGYLANQFNIMCEHIKDLFQKNEEKQELLRIAEIKNLQAQINPHFLYNTLDSIKWLAKINGESEIYIMVKNLSILLKNSIRLYKEFVPVKDSLTTLESYIAIQNIRFNDKFDVIFQIEDEVLSYKIPNLLLQPLVENAMLHGLEAKPGKGELYIRGFREQSNLILQVQDNGIGMTEQQKQELLASLSVKDSTLHIGVKNVHQRVRLYYGEPYGLTIESEPNQGSTFTLTLPWYAEEREV